MAIICVYFYIFFGKSWKFSNKSNKNWIKIGKIKDAKTICTALTYAAKNNLK